MTAGPLLTVTDLSVRFPVARKGLLDEQRWVRAVDGVSFAVERGKTFGLVGESGSGKTTVGRSILRLIPASGGQVTFDGTDLFSLDEKRMRALRRRMQIVFQDPMSSLNPRATVETIVAEPVDIHERLTRAERRRRVGELLERVGLSAAYARRYPHEFSGGQRQRIGIARALATRPDFIVCDEPVSALDVSIQAQILNLLSDLQKEFGISYLLIAHNLAVVEQVSSTVAVMYLGRIMEVAGRDELYAHPAHPYTQALLSAVPETEAVRRGRRVRLDGETPSPVSPPRGCPFHPRCPFTREMARSLPDSETAVVRSAGAEARVVRACTVERPALRPADGSPTHCHACLLKQGAM